MLPLMNVHFDRALAGVTAAALQIAIGELAFVAIGGTSSPVRAIGRWIIDALPGPLVDMSIALLERHDKAALLLTLVVTWLGAAGAASAAVGPEAAAVLLGLVGALGLAAGWRRPELRRARSAGAAALAAIGGPAALFLLAPMGALVLSAACLLAAAALERQRPRVPSSKLPRPTAALPAPPSGAEFAIAGLGPLFTPTDRFYVTDVTFPAPRMAPSTWCLEVTGLVAHPLRLSLQELLALDSVEVDSTLVCVHNPVGGHRVGTARWQGVPLATLLGRAEVADEADHVRAHSADGFSGGHPRSLVERALLVYGMNGEPLRREHGGPVRLILPGVYGYDANVKWLQRLEVTRFERARDYWERKGWPRRVAEVRTQSRIDVPRTGSSIARGKSTVAGVAWSPPRGITKVELSIDGGPWRSCQLAEELSPNTWRQWRFDWDATEGQHTLRVRAWSPDGVQEERRAPPFPDGATGHHVVEVTIHGDNRRPLAAATRAALRELAGRVGLARAGWRAWRR
jgi:DMSO/TMAO reductase YedYZ molybdopterin-dependent catalytic subunit